MVSDIGSIIIDKKKENRNHMQRKSMNGYTDLK